MTLEFRIEDALAHGELLKNALKHAFCGGCSGFVRLELSRASEASLRLAVVDNGVGLPPRFALFDAPSLGLQLVTTLAEQLHGELTVTSAEETRFEVVFDG